MIRRVLAWASLLAMPALFLIVRQVRKVKLVPQPRGMVTSSSIATRPSIA